MVIVDAVVLITAALVFCSVGVWLIPYLTGAVGANS
jgi:hypothetical protein